MRARTLFNESDDSKLPNRPRIRLEFRVVRQLRTGVLAVSACVLSLAVAAHAAEKEPAVFRVTLAGTLTKQWTYTDVDNSGECVRMTRGAGKTTIRLSMKRPVRVRAAAVGATRVRFSGSLVRIAGSVVRTASRTVTEQGDLPCQRHTISEGRCNRRKVFFAGASSSLRNPRKGVLQLGPLRRFKAARSPQCPPEPADIVAVRTDLPIATGPLDVKDVFGRDIPRFFVSGDTTQETTLTGDLEGKVVERVRWTLVFTRLER